MIDRLHVLVLLVILPVFCHGTYIQKYNGSSAALDIMYSNSANISDHSFTVAVLVDMDLLGGGALIEQNWVLTAASVLRGFNTSQLTVRVASNSAYTGGRVHTVNTSIVHPKYASNNSYNLAMLKLDTPIYPKVAAKVTYYARIPFNDNGVIGNLTGYGGNSASTQNDDDPGLQIVVGKMYTATYCNSYWSRSVSSLDICFYSYSAVPCHGDEGDPVTRCLGVNQCELMGIYTGIDECDTYKPAAMVDVVFCHGIYIQKYNGSSAALHMLNPDSANISDHSFTVAVLVDMDLLGGGALIEQNWVLTAASVLRGFNTSELTVRVASNSAFTGGRVHTLNTSIVHPKYASNNSYNLALLKLDTPIYPKVAAKVTSFARIPFNNNGILGNLTGYGGNYASTQNDDDPGLQIVLGHVYTASYCNSYWGRSVSGFHICFYSSYAVPCHGDEGDPLTRCLGVNQCELLGIYTGIDECDTYEPSAMVDVGQFAEWIRQTIRENS